MPAYPASLSAALLSRGWLLLSLTSLFWAGNVVASRLAVGEAPPMLITCLRWLACSTLLLALNSGQLRREWPLLAPRWRSLAWMGALGFTGYNALFYAAAHYTTGINMAIIQGAMPVFIVLGAVALGRGVSAAQVAGLILSTLGVLVVATRGDLSVLLALALNRGDLLLLLACVLYALYVVNLPNRPKVSGLTFFIALSLVAAGTSVPLMIWEIAAGASFWPTPLGWAVIAYIAVFPSMVAQLCFIRGVELVGPSRAGIFTNLVPVLGALLVVLILHEPFGLYHAAALALVMAGLWVTERKGK